MREEIKNTNKLGNKGFSLIELIIVIAIMAILIGIVGTQVVPYIETSKQAKDKQVLSSLLTNATTAFADCADDINDADKYSFEIGATTSDDAAQAKVEKKFYELAGLGTTGQFAALKEKMKSKAGNGLASVTITRNEEGVVTVEAKVDDDHKKYQDAFDILSST